jgi:hypothetical protein
VSKIRNFRGAQWCEDTITIILEHEHYKGYNKVSTLSYTLVSLDHGTLLFTTNTLSSNLRITPRTSPSCMNSNEMQLATGKCAMGSSEPLVTPSPDYPNTQESDIIILDGLTSLHAVHDMGRRYLQVVTHYDCRELMNLYFLD